VTVYSSVSVTGLEDLVAKLRIAHRRIDDFLGQTTERSVRTDMRALDVSSTGFQDLEVVQEWVDSALQETQRRLGLARALQSQQPGAPMVQVDEDLMVLDPALAERQGRDLAIRFEQAGGVDGDISGLMEDFAAIAHDPDAMAGFYAELGPELAARLAAAMGMPSSGVGENAQRYLELLSVGLGTALMDATPPDGLSELTGEFGQATDDPQVAWGRLALLQYGDFSGSQPFVEQTVSGTALDALAADDWADPQSNVSAQNLVDGDSATGLTGDIATLAFTTLNRYPDLTGRVLSEQDISVKEMTHRVYASAGPPGLRTELADVFGQTIEIATGSQGDPPNTAHTPEQAALAFEFITGSADHDEIPVTIKDTTARVAAAYVDEMLAGSYIDGGEMLGDRGSSMTAVPTDFPQGTGLNPDFYLSPRAVYRFLGGFQDELEYSAPFDEAMGVYMDQQLGGAIRADPAHGGGERYQSLLSLFGSLGALHYEARREFAADFDAQEQARRAALSTYISDGLGLIPGLPHLTWWAAQKGVNLGLGAWQARSDSEKDQVEAENRQASDLRWYASVQQLIDNAVLTEVQLKEAPSSLLDDGRLRPIEEIFADDATRQEFYDWVNATPTLDVPADAGQDAWDSGWQGGQTIVGRA
jgi:hypothetical protein